MVKIEHNSNIPKSTLYSVNISVLNLYLLTILAAMLLTNKNSSDFGAILSNGPTKHFLKKDKT